jgi:hypothetical protein
MKTIIAFLLTTVLIKHAECQEIFNGIDVFKINDYSIGHLMNYAKDNKLKIKIIDNRSDETKYKDIKNSLLELVPNKENKNRSPIYSIDVDGVRVFNIPRIKINNLDVSYITLSFKNNILFDIKCDYTPELGDLIEEKYGKGKMKSEEKEAQCMSTLKEITFYTSWDSDKITATAIQSKYYNLQCEEKHRAFLTIFDTKTTSEVINNLNK